MEVETAMSGPKFLEQTGVNVAVFVYFDEYEKDNGEVEEYPVIREDTVQMRDLLKEKFGYEIPSEDPVIFEPGSFENPDSLVIDFAQFLIKLRDHKSGTIVDRFLLYYHGHGALVLEKPCILTGTWEAVPLVELVNLVIKYINPL